MEKGLLKSKIAAGFAIGFMALTIHNLLFIGSSSYHIFKMGYDKNHLTKNDFATVEEYNEKMEYCDSELERVTPIRKGFIVAAGVSAVGTGVSYAILSHEANKKEKNIEETDTYIGG